METPTSDFGSICDISSEASTPGTHVEPFEPAYKVKVTEPRKDGDVWIYTIKSFRKRDNADFSVVRQYEDFEWFQHCILVNNNFTGLIIPPLSPKPIEDHLPNNKNTMSPHKPVLGEDYRKDCMALEKYLKLIVNHSVIGQDFIIEQFLTHKSPATRANLKKGFLGKLTSAMYETKKTGVKDINDYFQRQRDWANNQFILIKALSQSYDAVVQGEHKVSSAYGHLSTACNLGGGFNEVHLYRANKLLVQFSEALDDYKHGLDTDAANDDRTLAFHLDLYTRYTESLREMHNRRIALLLSYEDANRNLDKAKPGKREEAEDAKKAAEKAFENCSEQARGEIVVYSQQRILAFQEALIEHAECKIKTARDTHAMLAKSLAHFKTLQLDAL